MTYAEKINFIAQHYGREPQTRICQEECAELIQAINKYWRANGSGYPIEKTKNETIENLIEEMADVQITILEMQELFGCKDDVEKVMHEKIDRQIERIENENWNLRADH